jgi:integrase
LFQQFQRSKPLFTVALETGLTRGDLLGLRWTSVNLREGFIRVKRQKTGVEAVIPISRACRVALGECRSRRVVGENVFLTESGRLYAVSVVVRYFERAKRIAGIRRRFRFNDLRHTFASNLSSRGVANQLIAKALGHTSARMTEGYARPSEAALEIVRKALDATPTSETESSESGPGESPPGQNS